MTHLKFRAYHHKMKKMLTVRCIDFHDKSFDCIDGDECFLVKFEDCEIMQSTGMTDKNGEEIFEGDIIQDDDDEGFRCVVEYVNASFILKGKNGRYQMSDLFTSDVIIGNIYENSKLLNS